MEERYLTVKAINSYLEVKVKKDNNLKDILVKGEISHISISGGHYYMTIKDNEYTMRATMFKNRAYYLNFRPNVGDEVLMRGSIEVYATNGSYSLIIEQMIPYGEGNYKLLLEKLKKELFSLGYFEISRKREIPKYPKCVAVVTSATGAVVKDISKTISRRYSNMTMLIYPTLVQGTNAGRNIAAQIIRANRDNLADVIIVGRGGGSTEELACFNDRVVCDAIFNSKIPVISAVGHERDDTLSDLIADYRVSTPTAAGEKVTEHYLSVIEKYAYDKDRLIYLLNSKLESYKNILNNNAKFLAYQNPVLKINDYNNKLDELNNKLNNNILNNLASYKNNIDNELKLLNYYNPKEQVKKLKNELTNLTINLNSKICNKIFEYNNLLVNNSNNINRSIMEIINDNKNVINYKGLSLEKYNPSNNIILYSNDVSNKIDYLNSLINNKLDDLKHNFSYEIGKLSSLNPTSLLARGYTMTKHNDKYIKSVSDVKTGDDITVEFKDGILKATVKEISDERY